MAGYCLLSFLLFACISINVEKKNDIQPSRRYNWSITQTYFLTRKEMRCEPTYLLGINCCFLDTTLGQ